jgi:hypothetical protein
MLPMISIVWTLFQWISSEQAEPVRVDVVERHGTTCIRAPLTGLLLGRTQVTTRTDACWSRSRLQQPIAYTTDAY